MKDISSKYLNISISADIGSFIVDYGRNNLLKVIGDDPSEWCEYEPPMAYSYIQRVSQNEI